jgi:hypothetical protein
LSPLVFLLSFFLSWLAFYCLDIQRYFLNNWQLQGAELAADEGRSAAALAACRTLAEEITELRFPAPRILAFKVFFPLTLCIPFLCTFVLNFFFFAKLMSLLVWVNDRRGALKLDILFLG